MPKTNQNSSIYFMTGWAITLFAPCIEIEWEFEWDLDRDFLFFLAVLAGWEEVVLLTTVGEWHAAQQQYITQAKTHRVAKSMPIIKVIWSPLNPLWVTKLVVVLSLLEHFSSLHLKVYISIYKSSNIFFMVIVYFENSYLIF